MRTLTETKEVSNNGERKKTEVTEEEVFTVQGIPLIYTQAPGQYQKNQRSEKLNHASLVEQAINFWQKGPSFLEVFQNVSYGVPRELNMRNHGWTNLLSNIPSLPQEDRVYTVKRVKSGFKLLMRPERKNTA